MKVITSMSAKGFQSVKLCAWGIRLLVAWKNQTINLKNGNQRSEHLLSMSVRLLEEEHTPSRGLDQLLTATRRVEIKQSSPIFVIWSSPPGFPLCHLNSQLHPSPLPSLPPLPQFIISSPPPLFPFASPFLHLKLSSPPTVSSAVFQPTLLHH